MRDLQPTGLGRFRHERTRVAEASGYERGTDPAASSQAVLVDGCFGWLHRPAMSSPRQSDVGVLVCPALAWDGLHSHHGLRLLADEFAAAGHPTLRIQYPGTGNSRDIDTARDGSDDHWSAWLHCVNRSADWLRTTLGVSRLMLVGLRAGATLAALAAAGRDDVDGLALIAPVLRGKSYMRQLDMEARLESGASGSADGSLEFHEFRFGAQTVAAIGAVDLRRLALRAGLHVSLFPQASSQLVGSCAEAWVQSGVDVRCLAFEGLEPLLQEAIHSDPLAPDFSTVLDWTRSAFPCASSGPACVRSGSRGVPISPVLLTLPGCTEQPLRFGPDGRLFGVLCRPANAIADIAVIIGNTGRDPHFGIARFGVDLARSLAAAGIASLRMDYAGLGESASAPGSGYALSPLFDADRTADISAAIDALRPFGLTDIVLQGLCSGAYHALRAAPVDPRIGALLLVNLPVFEWHGGDTVQEAMWKSAPPGRLLARLKDKSALRRMVRGDIGVASILQGQGRQLLTRLRHRVTSARAGLTNPQRMVANLVKRHVKILFLYSSGDPGLDALAVTFGPEGQRLRAAEGLDLRIVPGIDHVLSARPMRETAAGHLMDFVSQYASARAAGVTKQAGIDTDDDTHHHPRSDHDGRTAAAANARTAAR